MRTVRVFVQFEATEEERTAAIAGLKAAAKFVRHELIDRLHLRRAPEVIFTPDESEAYGNRIDTLLQKVSPPKKPE
jgi:ribosome-binding factor A